MTKGSLTSSTTSTDEHCISAEEHTQQNNDISYQDSNACSGDELQNNDAKMTSRLKSRRKKQKQRAAKTRVPLSCEQREGNRKACAKYRESLNSGSESDKYERAQARQRKKCPLTDKQREGNRKASAKYRESLGSGSESDEQERAEARQRKKCPLTDKQREGNRKACAKYRESLNSGSENDKQERTQTRQRKKCLLTDKQREGNRQASAKYRESLSSGSETDKQDFRAKAKQRQSKRRDSASGSEEEDLSHQNEGEDIYSRNRRPNSKFICRFCHQEGHMQPLSIRSCPNFCTYCQGIAHNVKHCDKEKADAIRACKMNQDAKNYQNAIEQTMIFYTCAVCEVEHGLHLMTELSKVTDLIAKSEIGTMFDTMIAPLESTSSTERERAYATAAANELERGILKHATHVCNVCVRQLEGKGVHNSNADNAGASTIGNVPARALVNGYFRGQCPPELLCLTRVEVSLVTIINVCGTISMLKDGGHWGTQGTVFSVLNDVVEVASFLPLNPTPALHAIIRRGTTASPKDFRYNPHKVIQALRWLEKNNELYHNRTAIVIMENGDADPDWVGDGRDEDLEPPHIDASDEDYEGIEDKDKEDPAGADGHAVNPGAPDSSMTDVFLQNQPSMQSHAHQLQSVISGVALPVVTVRQYGEFVSDYKVEHFLAKAFPVLFPYGKGCPTGIKESEQLEPFTASYISHVLHLGGDRSFQKNPTFIFYCYSYIMRQKIGTISYLAALKNNDPSTALTVEAVKEFLENLKNDPIHGGITTAEQRSLMNKLKPYAKEIPGTELYFEKERKKLLAMISSPVTTSEGQWTWFFTEAQPDKYLAEIFDNAVTSARQVTGFRSDMNLEERHALSNNLTAQQRTEILRDHPFLSARIHGLQQDAFWKYVLNGEDKPLGEIADFWLRAEFQLKGTPHWHSLINILKKSLNGITKNSIESTDALERQKVLDYVEAACTNMLLRRDSDNEDELPDNPTAMDQRYKESTYDFNIDRTKYFRDEKHPARYRFDAANTDFSVNSATGQIKSNLVRKVYRRLQLANQMHLCRKSCTKYCKPGKKQRCRYDFPRVPLPGNSTGPVIVKDKDKRNRPRVKVHPTRNNAHINTCFTSPVCVLASRGNHDIQFIQNVRGGAEYCSKYASKAEAAETTALQNAINRKISNYVSQHHALPSLQQKLGQVANAVVEAQQVGAVQACYVLGKQPLVISSRTFVHINVLKRSELNHNTVIVDENELEDMDNADSAIKLSPTTQNGRRDAYHAYCLFQHTAFGEIPKGMSFYAFSAAYKLSTLTDKRKKCNAPKKIELDCHGFFRNHNTCVIEQVVYTAVRKKSVVCLSPPFPIDETSEASAYSILLLYSDWGIKGEDSILLYEGVTVTAVAKLQHIKEHLPEFILSSLRQIQESEELLADAGVADIESGELSEPEAEYGGNFELPQNYTGIHGVAPDLSSERYNYSTPPPNIAYMQQYVKGIIEAHRVGFNAQHRLTPEEAIEKLLNPNAHHDIPNVDIMREKLASDINQLNAEQRQAFDIAVEHVSGAAGRQMIMFLTGEGGTGKSKVIHTIDLYARILFGKVEGDWGVVLKTAPTGGAAHNIGGSTWHSALGSNGKDSLKCTQCIADSAVTSLQRKARGTVLFVLDELSLLSCENLYEISRRLQAATGITDQEFGGMHVLLAGDFYQMQQTIPQHKVEARLGRTLFTTRLTHFCELIYNVRAQLQAGGALSPLAKFTKHARIGDVTSGNGILHILNDRVVNTHDSAMRKALPGAIWITSTHKQISAINKKFKQANLKENKPLIKVIARHTPHNNTTPTPDATIRKVLYGSLGDLSGGRDVLMVSYMNLFVGTRVRLIRNLFVEGGLYNGAMGTVWGFMYRGAQPEHVPGTYKKKFGEMDDFEREIPIVLVQMDGDNDTYPSCSVLVPRLIPICEIPSSLLVNGMYKRHQLPILPAHARTSHSVQGYTAREGVVVEPGSRFFAGDYIAISRATEKEKVILLSPLVPEYFNCTRSHREYQILVEQEYIRLRNLFH